MRSYRGRAGWARGVSGGGGVNASSLRLLLRPGRGNGSVVALPVVAFAIVSALMLTVVGGAQSFWSWSDVEAPIYQALAAIALVLLVVPLASLGGAAARLSARRRDERLSTLRLLGVTPSGVTVVTVLESLLVAVAGVLVGVVVYLLLSPLIGAIPFRGTALGWHAVLLPPITVAAIASGILALAAISAIVGLRRVVVSPLGVRLRAAAPRVHWVRALIAAGVLAIAFAVVSIVPSAAGMVTIIVVLAAAFAAALAVLNVIGPWVLKVTASVQLRRARTAERLLAARIVLDAPQGTWRQVGGIAMASFMAVFAGTGVALMDLMANAESTAADRLLVTDMRTGLIITLIASFLMVAASVGVNQAADVLDRRDLHRSLNHLGVPVTTVDRARRRAVMSPLMITAIGSAACAAVVVLPLVGLALITAPLSLLTIVGVIAAGIGTVWLSTRLTRPLLIGTFAAA